ncbi:MAG TPA: diacylglycerol kinase family protein [Solirubrobacteraceae bacterium]|nr:diacylglycerol kinase family protein [Solirubrobacteraceae bacterium]
MALEELQRLAESAVPEAGKSRKRMLVVVNPAATTMSARVRSLVIAALHGRYEVEVVDTKARDHATDLCRVASTEGYDVVVSYGGDGTVNEVANGLAGCDTPLTCLPGGATNVLCKMLGIPGDIVDATEHLLGLPDRWKPRRIDLGVANGRAFTYSSGFGLDASVVKRIEASPGLKRHRLREYFFVYAAVETVLRHYVRHPPRMEVQVGGQTSASITTLVQNGAEFTYLDDKPIHIAEGGGLDTGSLAGVALRGVSPRDIPGIALRLLSSKRSIVGHRQIHAFSGVDGLRCVSSDGRAIPLHVDGDHIGDVTEAVFGIRPGALAVVA